MMYSILPKKLYFQEYYQKRKPVSWYESHLVVDILHTVKTISKAKKYSNLQATTYQDVFQKGCSED